MVECLSVLLMAVFEGVPGLGRGVMQPLGDSGLKLFEGQLAMQGSVFEPLGDALFDELGVKADRGCLNGRFGHLKHSIVCLMNNQDRLAGG